MAGGGNTVEDIRPVMVPEFHLQEVARQTVKQRVEDAHLLHSCSVSPKGAEGKIPLSCKPKYIHRVSFCDCHTDCTE